MEELEERVRREKLEQALREEEQRRRELKEQQRKVGSNFNSSFLELLTWVDRMKHWGWRKKLGGKKKLWDK